MTKVKHLIEALLKHGDMETRVYMIHPGTFKLVDVNLESGGWENRGIRIRAGKTVQRKPAKRKIGRSPFLR
jgi:hypothetical protein